MDRAEAVIVFKELLEQNIAQPSFITLSKNERGKYDLLVKGNCDTVALRAFLAGRNLIVSQDKEKNTCRIYRP